MRSGNGKNTAGAGNPFAGRTLVVQSFGGAVADAEAAAFYKPFEQKTGANVKIVEAAGDAAGQAKTGRLQWDMISGFPGADVEGHRMKLHGNAALSP